MGLLLTQTIGKILKIFFSRINQIDSFFFVWTKVIKNLTTLTHDVSIEFAVDCLNEIVSQAKLVLNWIARDTTKHNELNNNCTRIKNGLLPLFVYAWYRCTQIRWNCCCSFVAYRNVTWIGWCVCVCGWQTFSMFCDVFIRYICFACKITAVLRFSH